MGVQTNLTCPRGQNKTWTASYSPATNITGYHFAFTARDLAGNQLLQATTGSGITITDPVNGVLTIQVTAAQTTWPATVLTQSNNPPAAFWDLWRTDAGFEDQIGYGQFIILPSYRV